jgi:hypothetical protein
MARHVTCLFRYRVESLGAQAWVVVVPQVPLDMFVLWHVLRKPQKMAFAYVSICAIYVVFHIGLGMCLHYDSLIPAWRLHA